MCQEKLHQTIATKVRQQRISRFDLTGVSLAGDVILTQDKMIIQLRAEMETALDDIERLTKQRDEAVTAMNEAVAISSQSVVEQQALETKVHCCACLFPCPRSNVQSPDRACRSSSNSHR